MWQLVRRYRRDRTLPTSQVSALVWIDGEGPSTTSKLAALEHVRPQSMAHTVGQLEAAGLITRTRRPRRRAQGAARPHPAGPRHPWRAARTGRILGCRRAAPSSRRASVPSSRAASRCSADSPRNEPCHPARGSASPAARGRIDSDVWYTDSRNASFLVLPIGHTAMTAGSFAWPPLADDQRELLALVRTLATEQIAPRAAEIDETPRVPLGHRRAVPRAGPVRALLRGAPRRHRDGSAARAGRDRGGLEGLRDLGPDPRGAGARLARAQARRLGGAAGPVSPPARVGRVARRLRADRVGLGLGLGRAAHDGTSATATTTC